MRANRSVRGHLSPDLDSMLPKNQGVGKLKLLKAKVPKETRVFQGGHTSIDRVPGKLNSESRP
jgi:hypothetical protein